MYLCMHIQCNMCVFSPSCRTVHAVRWSTWAALARWAEHAWVWRSRWSESGDTSRGRCVNEDERTDRCPAASPSPKTTPTTPYRYQRSLCAYMRYGVIGWDFVYFEDRNVTLWTLCVSWLWSEVYKCSAMSCTVSHKWSSSDLHEYISNGPSVSHSHHASGPEGSSSHKPALSGPRCNSRPWVTVLLMIPHSAALCRFPARCVPARLQNGHLWSSPAFLVHRFLFCSLRCARRARRSLQMSRTTAETRRLRSNHSWRPNRLMQKKTAGILKMWNLEKPTWRTRYIFIHKQTFPRTAFLEKLEVWKWYVKIILVLSNY